MRYHIKTSAKDFCDTIATSIARYEEYRCWASKQVSEASIAQKLDILLEFWCHNLWGVVVPNGICLNSKPMQLGAARFQTSVGARWHCMSKAMLFSRGIKRDKRNGTNGARFAVFRWFLQIFAFPGNYSILEVQIFAANGRKPQIFAENCRKPQIFAEICSSHLVCPFDIRPMFSGSNHAGV